MKRLLPFSLSASLLMVSAILIALIMLNINNLIKERMSFEISAKVEQAVRH